VRHHRVHQRHAGATVHHIEGVEMFVGWRKSDLGFAAVHAQQLETKQFNKGDVDRKIHKCLQEEYETEPIDKKNLLRSEMHFSSAPRNRP
jgi:hypothetical protein